MIKEVSEYPEFLKEQKQVANAYQAIKNKDVTGLTDEASLETNGNLIVA